MTKGDWSIAVSAVWKMIVIGVSLMVGIDDKFANTAAKQVLKGELDQWPSEYRNERLRKTFCKFSQPGTESGTEDKSLIHGMECRCVGAIV